MALLPNARPTVHWYCAQTLGKKGRLETFSPRWLTIYEVWCDLFTWLVQKPPGLGYKYPPVVSPGTQRRNISEPPLSNLKPPSWKAVRISLPEDKIWLEIANFVAIPPQYALKVQLVARRYYTVVFHFYYISVASSCMEKRKVISFMNTSNTIDTIPTEKRLETGKIYPRDTYLAAAVDYCERSWQAESCMRAATSPLLQRNEYLVDTPKNATARRAC